MAQFILTYLGGDKPITPEAGKQHFAEYQQWLSDLGNAVISPANPLKDTTLVLPNGKTERRSATGMSGYTIIEADDLEAALEMARFCPFLRINGTLEVSELIPMSI